MLQLCHHKISKSMSFPVLRLSDPTICFNTDYTLPYDSMNTTSSATSTTSTTLRSLTTTKKGVYFVCPDTDTEWHTYCCGEEGSQRCCGFWDE